MKKLLLAICASTVFSLNVQSQNDPNKVNSQAIDNKACLKLSYLSISMDNNKYRTMGDDGKDFHKMSKDQNSMHSGDMGSMMNHLGSNFNSGRKLNFEVGFNPYSKKLNDYNKKREILFGLYYSGSDLANRKSTKMTSVPGDTFSHNSVMYQNDTIKRTQKSYREEANVLGLTFQYLYKTDPEKRFSLFAGYGINLGYAVNARIYKRSSKDSAIVVGLSGAQPSFELFNNETKLGTDVHRSSVEAKPTFLTNVFIPVGLNLRLSQSREILNKMNLFVKADMGLQVETIVNRRAHFNPYIGCGFGLTYDLR